MCELIYLQGTYHDIIDKSYEYDLEVDKLPESSVADVALNKLDGGCQMSKTDKLPESSVAHVALNKSDVSRWVISVSNIIQIDFDLGCQMVILILIYISGIRHQMLKS